MATTERTAINNMFPILEANFSIYSEYIFNESSELPTSKRIN